MAYCSYCDERAVVDIPAIPSPVCLEHAVEFWTGVLAYARQHAEHAEPMKTHATCAICKELSAARARTIGAAVAAVPTPPQPAAPRALRLASTRRTANVVSTAASEWSAMGRG
jgi:hypothetical protein